MFRDVPAPGIEKIIQVSVMFLSFHPDHRSQCEHVAWHFILMTRTSQTFERVITVEQNHEEFCDSPSVGDGRQIRRLLLLDIGPFVSFCYTVVITHSGSLKRVLQKAYNSCVNKHGSRARTRASDGRGAQRWKSRWPSTSSLAHHRSRDTTGKIEGNEHKTTCARECVAKVEAKLRNIFKSILTLTNKIAELSIKIDSEKCGAMTDFRERAEIMKEKFGSDENVVRKNGCCGPGTEGANMVGDATRGVQHRIEEQIADVPLLQAVQELRESFQPFHRKVLQRVVE